MKNINDLKERLDKDVEFKKLFANKKSVDELINIARENGYEVSKEDLEKDESLAEDALEAVSGGSKKGEEDINEYYFYS